MSDQAPPLSSPEGRAQHLSVIGESIASFGVSDLDAESGIILKDWSAKDFANIYVRFRPHLVNHARKFLKDEAEAEEVVQDAFLYLMTALPELDSQLGVLKFLKWKTKMLCLDIIRSSQSGLRKNLVALPNDIPVQAQLPSSVERADDAAVINLALAKLNPRQREALIATIYEEKTHEEVAHRLGVSENAFRQLLLRARRSFRQALVGEAAIEGKSAAEILSVAARKAARDSGKWASGVGLFLILAVVATGWSPGKLAPAETLASPIPPESLKSEVTLRNLAEPDFQEQRSPSSQATSDFETVEFGLGELLTNQEQVSESSASRVDQVETVSESKSNLSGERVEEVSQLANLLTSQLTTELARELQSSDMVTKQNSLVVYSGSGFEAHVGIDTSSASIIQHLVLEFSVGEHNLTSVPLSSHSVVDRTTSGFIEVSYAATDFIVGDFTGTLGYEVVDHSPLTRAGLLIEMVLDDRGSVVEAKVRLLPRA